MELVGKTAKRPDEVYLVIIGESQQDARPMIFSKDGTKLFDTDQIKSLQGGEGVPLGPTGRPEGKPEKVLIKDAGLASQKIFVLKGVVQEPTEIDALCHFSNMLGDGNGTTEGGTETWR